METIKKKIKDLIPYKNNARLNDETVERLAKSIEDYGYVVPIVIDHKNVLVTGHARLKAIKKLGWKNVECVVSNLSEEENKEYRIIDNKIQDITEWNDDLLVTELRGLQHIASEFDLKVNTALETSYGMFDDAVTNADIEKQENKFETGFVNRANQANDSLIQVSCEHCGANFGIEADKL